MPVILVVLGIANLIAAGWLLTLPAPLKATLHRERYPYFDGWSLTVGWVILGVNLICGLVSILVGFGIL